jgi:hypothetical protein
MPQHDDRCHHAGQNQKVNELFFSEESNEQNKAKYQEK